MKSNNRRKKSHEADILTVRTPLDRYVFSAEQVREAKAGKSDDVLLEEIAKLMGEKLIKDARWTFKRLADIPDYFHVYETRPACRRAEPQGRLLERWESLQVQGQNQAAGVLRAFQSIHMLGLMREIIPSSPAKEANGSLVPKTVCEMIHQTFVVLDQSIGPLLHNIVYAEKKRQSDSLKTLKKVFDLACNRWFARSAPALAHGHSKKLFLRSSNNLETLPLAAIEASRLFCEATLRLPTKSELQQRLESYNSELKEWKSPRWARLWKEAGLDGLPRATQGHGIKGRST